MTPTTTSKQWYIVHTYSGFEKKVAESLRQRAKAYELEDQIGRIEIPTEEVVEMKGGRKVPPATRLCPVYVLVVLVTEVGPDGKKSPEGPWHLERNTPKAAGCGCDGFLHLTQRITGWSRTVLTRAGGKDPQGI